jgi:two-component system chemotaxis sensor kinase CheA
MKDAMQPAILALENPKTYSEQIGELYRIFRNLQSASIYLKFKAMERLSEFIGDSLEAAQASEGPAPETYIDWLLKASDQYAQWFVDLVNNRERFSAIAHGELFNVAA